MWQTWPKAVALDEVQARRRRVARRLLSAHTTCRLRRRSLFAYLTDAIAAHARGDSVPLLA